MTVWVGAAAAVGRSHVALIKERLQQAKPCKFIFFLDVGAEKGGIVSISVGTGSSNTQHYWTHTEINHLLTLWLFFTLTLHRLEGITSVRRC